MNHTKELLLKTKKELIFEHITLSAVCTKLAQQLNSAVTQYNEVVKQNRSLQQELSEVKAENEKLKTALLKIKKMLDENFVNVEGCGSILCEDCKEFKNPDRCSDAKILDIVNEVLKVRVI